MNWRQHIPMMLGVLGAVFGAGGVGVGVNQSTRAETYQENLQLLDTYIENLREERDACYADMRRMLGMEGPLPWRAKP